METSIRCEMKRVRFSTSTTSSGSEPCRRLGQQHRLYKPRHVTKQRGVPGGLEKVTKVSCQIPKMSAKIVADLKIANLR
jgi:hypothetical protein